MVRQFIIRKHKKEFKKNELASKSHKQLHEFIPKEQIEREKIQSVESEIFEHQKKVTKKVLKK